MQSTLSNVDDYLRSVPEGRKDSMLKLRELCLDNLTGFEESMEYGMPSYKRNGVVEVSFNSQKNFIAVYILRKDVLDKHRSELTSASLGKGCIRYSNVKKIQF